MKQPALGMKISEIRNQRSMTQKELSDACTVDIRTIQRIESGEVTPRISTLKIVAVALSCDLRDFNGAEHHLPSDLPHKLLLALLLTGVINFISWILFSPIIPADSILRSVNLFAGLLHTVTGVLFYFGFYQLGKLQKNRLLSLSALITMACIPLFLIALLLSSTYGFAGDLGKLIIVLMGINSIFFGIALLKNSTALGHWYKIAGVLQILLAPFFVLQLPILNLIGCWLSIPFLLLLLVIVFLEFKESKRRHTASNKAD